MLMECLNKLIRKSIEDFINEKYRRMHMRSFHYIVDVKLLTIFYNKNVLLFEQEDFESRIS